MPVKKRVVEIYRQDENFGHKLLTPDEQRNILKVRLQLTDNILRHTL